MLTMNLDKKSLVILSLMYIYLPIVIFLGTWTRPYIALACIGVLFLCALRCIRSSRNPSGQAADGNIQTGLWTVLGSLLFFIAIGYYAGYGRFADQPFDWYKHNAIMADLTSRPWPVYYTNRNEYSMLTYYIAQYIVPSAIGKIFGSFRCTEIALYAWNILGIFLVFLHMISYLKSKSSGGQILCALAIPLFSLPVALSRLVLKYFTATSDEFKTGIDFVNWYYYNDGIKIQYFDNFYHLRWTFPQVITIWLILMLFLEYKTYIKYYVLIMLPGMLYSSFSFVGMLPLAFGYVLERICKKDKNVYFQMLSFENISVILTTGLVFIFYFYGNVGGEKPDGINFHLMPYGPETAVVYFAFVGINVLIYFLVLFKDHKNDGIYYASFGTLAFLPLVSMGLHNDLLTRSAIPSLFIVMIYLMLFLRDQRLRLGAGNFTKSIRVAVCLVLLAVGAYYPLAQLADRIATEDYHSLGRGYWWPTMEGWANRKLRAKDDLKYNYYTYDLKDKFFYKYLAPHD